MKFSIFPKRTRDDRKTEIRDALWTIAIFTVIAIVGLGWSFYTIEHPMPEGSWLNTASKIALVLGFLSAFGILHGLFGLFVAATIGVERMIVLLIGVFLLGSLFAAYGWG